MCVMTPLCLPFSIVDWLSNTHRQAFKQVFGVDKMDMFQMTKLLSAHMKSKSDVV